MTYPREEANLEKYHQALREYSPVRKSGRVIQVVSLTIEAVGLDCQIGELCEVYTSMPDVLLAEVVGFRDDRLLLMPLGEMRGIKPGSYIYPTGKFFKTFVGEELLGRVLNGLGKTIDGLGPLHTEETKAVYQASPNPLKRTPIDTPLVTGVRAIDGLLTCGKGQRIGIFAGSGVGKSTLMGSIARNSESDISVIALIGERGREVREFIERDLQADGLARSVVVVSTSDDPAIVRLKAAWTAITIAEHFRDQGMHVTFLMDSVTRFAMAQREIGLAIGEPPASKGYTPSVFALMPKLLERMGTDEQGSITGFITVLVEGDDFNEPISDAARSILDGHIMLTRELAAQNHYPAIDVLHSVSRLMTVVADDEHLENAGLLRRLLAAYEKARDLINIGAYISGSDPEIDAALAVLPKIMAFLQQATQKSTPFEETIHSLADALIPEEAENVD